MALLTITNGDSASDLLTAAGQGGSMLPWRDVLHEGPIVSGALEESSAVRSAYLAGRFGLDAVEVAAEFAARDAVLRDHAAFDMIELWFEHDLYDQLQLIQILSFFADVDRRAGVLLVQANDFLGQQSADSILRFRQRARPVTEDDLDTADLLWADLSMPTPESTVRRLEEPMDHLPFIGPAIQRFLEELPSPRNGLGRTEATALSGLTEGPRSAIDLFRLTIAAEEAAFMGDMSFFRMLHDLADAETPLISGLDRPTSTANEGVRYGRPLSLTETGRAVLAGDADHVRLNGIDRWWGGTRLKGRTTWRYDRDQLTLISPQASAA
ncbi:MAG TPA: hypothetical protein VFK86_05855 [Bauldia sp.]|nr:hypothetical protein [Bauldia sp.]